MITEFILKGSFLLMGSEVNEDSVTTPSSKRNEIAITNDPTELTSVIKETLHQSVCEKKKKVSSSSETRTKVAKEVWNCALCLSFSVFMFSL